MIKEGLSILLVACLTVPALAANELGEGQVSKPSALPVSELLQRAAGSPLGPGEAGLLRAVADLIDQEQIGSDLRSAPARESAIASKPVAAAVRPAPPMPAPKAAPAEPRKRLAIRLRHAPVVDVAKALDEFLDSEQKVRRSYDGIPNRNRAVFVPEPISNSLLVSGTPEVVESLTELIAQLDAPPDVVMVDVCIAELLPPSGDAGTDDAASDDSAIEKAPHIEEDGAAWLAWAKKSGRLEVLCRPRIMTLDNQPAMIKTGTTVPTLAPRPGTDDPAKGNPIEQTEVGLTVGLTPRVSPEGLVVTELDVEHTTVVDPDGAVGPIIGKTTAQTTISAKDGQTIVLGGMMHRAEDGRPSLVIAVTPRVNPKR